MTPFVPRITRLLPAIAILLAYCTVAGAQPGQANQPPPPVPQLHKIKDDLYVIENTHAIMGELIYWGGNATAYLTSAGVILVDSKFERAHDDLVAKVNSLTDKPIKYVILTHNHGDHSGGAEKLEAMGATVIISADDRDNMARTPNQSWLPAEGYVGQMRLVLGGKDVELRQLRGHTRGDTIVYFPADRVVCAGDLLTTSDQIPGIVSYPDGGSWTDWQKSIDEILKMDFDEVIPGHGPPITKAELVTYRNKMAAMLERFRAMNREHKSQEEITQTLVKEFNWGSGPSAGNIPGMMQELR
jgi:glyoxylase-like metal-dependent hydrolase (beta-lactamase superfamily II)